MAAPPLALTADVLHSYAAAAVYHDKESAEAASSSPSSFSAAAAASASAASAVPRTQHMAFSFDGSLLYTAQTDNSLLVFNAGTSKRVNTFRQLREGVSLVQPTHDNQTVVCAPAGGRQADALKGRRGNVANTQQANRLYCWSLHSNTVVGCLTGHDERVQSLHACRTDETYVSASSQGDVRLWDLRQGDRCVAQCRLSARLPTAAAFSHDGRTLAVAGARRDGGGAMRHQVNFFDRRAGLEALRPVSCVASPVWDAAARMEGRATTHMSGWASLRFSPDDEQLVATPHFRAAAVDVPHAGLRQGPRLAPHSLLRRNAATAAGGGGPQDYAFATELPCDMDLGDQNWTAIAGGAQGRSGMFQLKLGLHHQRSVPSFSPDSRQIVFGDTNNVIQVWSCPRGRGGGSGKRGALKRKSSRWGKAMGGNDGGGGAGAGAGAAATGDGAGGDRGGTVAFSASPGNSPSATPEADPSAQADTTPAASSASEDSDEELDGPDEEPAFDEEGKMRCGYKRVASWRGHISAVGPLQWSPRTEMVASGGGNLIMWLPRVSSRSSSSSSSI